MATTDHDVDTAPHPTAERIIDATIAAIEASGEAAVRLGDIANSLGLTVPAIYRYFADRDALIVAAHAERVTRHAELSNAVVAAWMDGMTSRQDLIDRIDDMAGVLISVNRRDELFMRAEVVSRIRHNPELAARIDGLQSRNKQALVELLTTAQQRGWVLAEANLPVVVELLYAIGVGQIMWYLDAEPTDADACRQAVADLLRHYLFGIDARPLGVTRPLPAAL